MRLRPAVAFLVVLAVCHGAGAGRIAATPPVPRWDLLTLVAADPARPAGRSVGPHQEYGATRQVVAVRVPDRLAYPLVVPPGAVLDFGFAVQATRFMAFSPELADPVRVRALLTTAGGEERVLFDRAVDVREKSDDRRWFDARVDLGAYAGQTVTLALEAAADRDRARGETTVLLSAPRVVTPAGPDEPSLLLVTIDC